MNRNIIAEARERGHDHGVNDGVFSRKRNDSPLSGEWAGESLNELLGDLLALAENDEHQHEVCEAYEDGYFRGYLLTKVF
jgi:hypothetical protein